MTYLLSDMQLIMPWINSLRPSDAYMHQQINHHWFRQWLVAWPAPSHYLNHCWNIVNWTLGNKLQWNFNRNLNIFIQEMRLKNVVCKMASILLCPQCVNSLWPGGTIWRHRSGLTLALVIGLMATNHLPEPMLTPDYWHLQKMHKTC